MIATLETPADVEKFTELLGEEAKRWLKSHATLDMRDEIAYAKVMSATKVRFRAWQMEQPGYDESGAAYDYQREAMTDELQRKHDERVRQLQYARLQKGERAGICWLCPRPDVLWFHRGLEKWICEDHAALVNKQDPIAQERDGHALAIRWPEYDALNPRS